MNVTIIGVFKSTIDAESAIKELREKGVTETELSYIAANNVTLSDKANDTLVTMGKGAASGASTGVVIGALAGLVLATGILPGLGTLIVAGPIASALGLTGMTAATVAGAATAAATFGLIGALVGLGMSATDARMYETRVKNGEILVIAHGSSTELETTFKKFNADEIKEYVAA